MQTTILALACTHALGGRGKRETCAIVRGMIKGDGVPIYAIWRCTLGLPSANMRVNEILALPASLLGSEFTSETILQVQRAFLTIPAMYFKATTIKTAQQDAVIRYQQLVTFHTVL